MKKNKRYLLFGVWLFSVLVWTAYRFFFTFSEPIDEFIFKPIVFVGPVLLYLFFKEKITAENLGFRTRNVKKILAWGGGFGLLLAFEQIVVGQLKGDVLSFSGMSLTFILIVIITSLATAFSEELLYRGFLLERLWTILKQPHLANTLVSVMFIIHHLGVALFVLNYHDIFGLTTYLLTIFVVSYADGFIYQKTRSVYASILAHFLWNASSFLFL